MVDHPREIRKVCKSPKMPLGTRGRLPKRNLIRGHCTAKLWDTPRLVSRYSEHISYSSISPCVGTDLCMSCDLPLFLNTESTFPIAQIATTGTKLADPSDRAHPPSPVINVDPLGRAEEREGAYKEAPST